MLLLIIALSNGVVGNKGPCQYFKFQVWGPLRMAPGKTVYFNKLFHIIPYSILLEPKHTLDLSENSKEYMFPHESQQNSLSALGSKISAYT